MEGFVPCFREGGGNLGEKKIVKIAICLLAATFLSQMLFLLFEGWPQCSIRGAHLQVLAFSWNTLPDWLLPTIEIPGKGGMKGYPISA